MNNKSPIFQVHESPHFSDYGFDPQIGYFQVLKETKNQKRDSSSFRSAIDTLHFKLQKPISKDSNSKKIKKNRTRWWKNAIRFFKRQHASTSDNNIHRVSRPVYLAESGSACYHHGPYSGKISIPYIDLNEFNMDQTHRISASPMPIYLVT